jgi:Tfp pilus assembly protein PilP
MLAKSILLLSACSTNRADITEYVSGVHVRAGPLGGAQAVAQVTASWKAGRQDQSLAVVMVLSFGQHHPT